MPDEPSPDRPTRRQLLVLAAAAVVVGCDRQDRDRPEPAATKPAAAPASQPAADQDAAVFDVGPLDDYGRDAVYAAHREDGFFLVRRDGELFALSAVCPHKGCKVRPQSDGSFECPCHHSEFAPDGRVLKGPAKTDLPRLAVKLDDQRHVLVDADRKV